MIAIRVTYYDLISYFVNVAWWSSWSCGTPIIIWFQLKSTFWSDSCWLGRNLWNCIISTLRPRQNGHHFPGIFKCIFLNENVWIVIKISLNFVPKGPINNISVLVQIMAWRRPGDKPLSEPMMVSLLMHICVTQPQWVNCEALWLQSIYSTWWLFGWPIVIWFHIKSAVC